MVAQIDPVCGAQVSEDAALVEAQFSERLGQRYYFCAMACKAAFDREPLRYLAPRDPVCGKLIERKEPPSPQLRASHEGMHYQFCSPECRDQFEQAPSFYAANARRQSLIAPEASEEPENLWP